MFTLHHQDGNIQYQLEQGGFCLEDDYLYLSIKAQAIDDQAFPDSYYFSVGGVHLDGGLCSQRITVASNADDDVAEEAAKERLKVNVYTTFHAADIDTEIEIEVLSEQILIATVRVTTEDVKYYDERAKPNIFTGTVQLSTLSMNELWLP